MSYNAWTDTHGNPTSISDLDAANQLFHTGPLVDKSRYHEKIYSPIQKPAEGYVVFAGYSLRHPNSKLPVFQDPALVCMDHDPKFVEAYMFSVRKYECLNTYKSKEYGGSHYTQMGNTNAFGVILYYDFGTESEYNEFLARHYTLSRFTFVHYKSKVDQDFCNHFPDMKVKPKLPKIIHKIIDQQFNTFSEELRKTIEFLKYFLLLSNIDNLTMENAPNFDKMDKSKLINPESIPLMQVINYLLNVLAYSDTNVADDKLPSSVCEMIMANIERRAPILFESETHYRMEIRAEIEGEFYNDEFRSIIQSKYPMYFGFPMNGYPQFDQIDPDESKVVKHRASQFESDIIAENPDIPIGNLAGSALNLEYEPSVAEQVTMLQRTSNPFSGLTPAGHAFSSIVIPEQIMQKSNQ